MVKSVLSVFKLGTGLVVTIPKKIALELGIDENSMLKATAKDGSIVYNPVVLK